MTNYFHSAPLLLEPGSIIKPGNWGRILNCYRQGNNLANAWMLARELAFEAVRTAEFAALPSRLAAAFVFETLNDVNQYRRQFSRWNSIYECCRSLSRIAHVFGATVAHDFGGGSRTNHMEGPVHRSYSTGQLTCC